MNILAYLAIAVIAYLLGSISTGMLVSKAMGGPDLHKVGSGNTGATNALRTMGKKGGAIVFAGDVVKALLAWAFHRETGGELGFERRILSVDGKSLILPGYEPVDTIALDWQDAGALVMEEAVRRIEQPGTPARRIFLNGTLKTAERTR